jgi:hypothetical protein
MERRMSKNRWRSLLAALARPFTRQAAPKPATEPRMTNSSISAASVHLLQDEAELTTWFETHSSCPDCGGLEFLDGPRGGMSQNIQCARPSCGTWFNTARLGGHFLFVQRIHPEGSPGRTLH